MEDLSQWLSLNQAAKDLGYSHPESLRKRLRELRKRGMVLDLGEPPSPYELAKGPAEGKINIYWLNAKTAMIRRDVPEGLLIPKRGKRHRLSS